MSEFDTGIVRDEPFDRGDVELIAAQITNVEVARLLLAAPAMYEALRALLYDIDCLPDSIKDFLNTEHIKAGEDAIAKAEGVRE